MTRVGGAPARSSHDMARSPHGKTGGAHLHRCSATPQGGRATKVVDGRSDATTRRRGWWRQHHDGQPSPAIAFVDVFADLHAACVRWHGADVADRDEMWQALQRLPHQQRVAVVLRYYEGLSVAGTAGCSVSGRARSCRTAAGGSRASNRC